MQLEREALAAEVREATRLLLRAARARGAAAARGADADTLRDAGAVLVPAGAGVVRAGEEEMLRSARPREEQVQAAAASELKQWQELS